VRGILCHARSGLVHIVIKRRHGQWLLKRRLHSGIYVSRHRLVRSYVRLPSIVYKTTFHCDIPHSTHVCGKLWINIAVCVIRRIRAATVAAAATAASAAAAAAAAATAAVDRAAAGGGSAA
jgi:hypothetical protein